MYAIVTDEKTKVVSVGIGTDTKFYESIGMTDMEVEQAYDGNWYVKGYAPDFSRQIKLDKTSQLAADYEAARFELGKYYMEAFLEGDVDTQKEIKVELDNLKAQYDDEMASLEVEGTC